MAVWHREDATALPRWTWRASRHLRCLPALSADAGHDREGIVPALRSPTTTAHTSAPKATLALVRRFPHDEHVVLLHAPDSRRSSNSPSQRASTRGPRVCKASATRRLQPLPATLTPGQWTRAAGTTLTDSISHHVRCHGNAWPPQPAVAVCCSQVGDPGGERDFRPPQRTSPRDSALSHVSARIQV